MQPKIKGTAIQVEGKLNHPPMERTASTVELFEKAKKVAQELGINLTEKSAGGGSDGNFTAILLLLWVSLH